MPVDPPRRSIRKSTAEDDTDIRRARGELSCAECRRLKLKCDKKLPCSSCIRRGCPSICPNGSLSSQVNEGWIVCSTYDGVVSNPNTDHPGSGYAIRPRIDGTLVWQDRRDGTANPATRGCSSHLPVFHRLPRVALLLIFLTTPIQVVCSTHPLLRDELLSIKFGPEKGVSGDRKPKSREASMDSIDALGTLTIGDDGEGKYFGRSAGSETLLLAGAELDIASSPTQEDTTPLNPEIAQLSNSFPFSAGGPPGRTLDLLFEYLPDQPRAWTLCETYLEQCSWSFRPLNREEIIDDFLTPIYKSLRERQSWTDASDFPHTISPHRLAVLLMLFALGALVDLTLEPDSVESDHYYHASRAALALRSVFDSPELATVQAVVLLASYHNIGGKNYTADSSWTLICLGSKLGQSVRTATCAATLFLLEHNHSSAYVSAPLHMCQILANIWQTEIVPDGTWIRRLSIDGAVTKALFWEMFSLELFQSVALGRPPSIRLSYVDCEFPAFEDLGLDENGDPRMSYYEWRYTFTRDVYETILELDKLVRAKTLPQHLNTFLAPEDENCTPSTYMRSCLLGQFRAVALLYIHRTFFAQAMLDHPANPLRSPYAPSFLAAYRCASGMIKGTLNHFERFPELCCRWSTIWTHVFSAAIIVGSIVTRSPSASMAATAFIELGLVCDLFDKGAKKSRRARSGLAILCKLREKAYQVYSQFRGGNPAPLPTTGFGVGTQDYGEDELALFGGQTRILVSKLISRKKQENTSREAVSPSSHSGMQMTPTPSSSLSSPASDAMPDVHPSLVDYLSLFAPTPQTPEYPMGINSASIVDHEMQLFPQEATPGFSYPDYGQGYTDIMTGTLPDRMQYDVQPVPDPRDLSDMGFFMSGDAGIDEQWKSFMKKSFSGLLEEDNNNITPVY
ncbi:unnamed protein product [Mycena citricolor]|uniref:Zn(2)-C6 fungal-type domain-containing protein n=1 Tax=Mycena citricolor TaxID=2018698 RepID=A0AAD2HIX6_9AGAR|nr:unnamed protein product [Mycena citricolor]